MVLVTACGPYKKGAGDESNSTTDTPKLEQAKNAIDSMNIEVLEFKGKVKRFKSQIDSLYEVTKPM